MDETLRISKYSQIKVHVNSGLALNHSALHAGYNVTSKLILHGEHASKMPLDGQDIVKFCRTLQTRIHSIFAKFISKREPFGCPVFNFWLMRPSSSDLQLSGGHGQSNVPC